MQFYWKLNIAISFNLKYTIDHDRSCNCISAQWKYYQTYPYQGKQDLVNYLFCTSDNGMWKNNNRFPRLVKVMSCLIKRMGSFHVLQKFPRHNLVSAFYILYIWFMLTLQVLCPTDPSFVFRTCLQNKYSFTTHNGWQNNLCRANLIDLKMFQDIILH